MAVRVIARQTHQRQHFAGARVYYERGAGFRVVGVERRLQRRLRQILDARIDRQYDISAVDRVLAPVLLDYAALTILDHAPVAIATG